ncbi:acyl-CoA thioester hydrolase/BAAT C-terminal domain-containing protein [Nocardioides sp. QY071]|uniref:alpha/beta fold hydrolase n=1 Tax=Nocardioides sp. QY071 TaxID=3044187 RepID=UPI002499BE7C|nr:alpha/beta fold hydrolase [Nocardioides sp. QY071]WGY04681.1 acyl-CoA thioester hydrolase/BAAT C-terminal domain-containing protein [Nocardioides sp. QY071]
MARRIELSAPVGVRWEPDDPVGVGALVLGGSSGRVDEQRARLLAEQGVLAESIQWFGGPEQHDGPWEIPLETFAARAESLAAECDRVLLVGLSFGAEAALATASLTQAPVDGVAAFAPSDVVWAGVTGDGRQTSHWTLDGAPVPFVRFVHWEPPTDPPAYRDLYARSRAAAPEDVAAASLPVERIPDVVLVAGDDDQVWPAREQAEEIVLRRARHGRATSLVADPQAGHRAVLPGEDVVEAGLRMCRGGTADADRRLGSAAWPALLDLVGSRA